MFLLLALAAILVLIMPVTVVSAADKSDLFKENNFGGASDDTFRSVVAVPDGFVAVGYSAGDSFGTGDWEDIIGVSYIHATIVKYDRSGHVVWMREFGGNGTDQFRSVIAVQDGVIAVGYSFQESFESGDFIGITGKGGVDAIIVKFDNNGDVVWKKNFGGKGDDYFLSAVATPDGFVVSGLATSPSFDNGDWKGVTKKGYIDAITVKFDNNGDVVWKKNFGGSVYDYFTGVTAVSDGYVAVGYSSGAYGNFDWDGYVEKGSVDAIIVKYDNNGNVVWKKNFGGGYSDYFYSVTSVPDGVVAVGYSVAESFGSGDWEGFTVKGTMGGTIVKFDNSGNVVWKKCFCGAGADQFRYVVTVSDGVVAVGSSSASSFGTGDWTGIEGKGYDDATAVRYDSDGEAVWIRNYGGAGGDCFYSATTTLDHIVAVGYSDATSFGNGDWKGFYTKGARDAIIVNISTGTGYIGDDDDNNGNVDTMFLICIALIAVIGIGVTVALLRRKGA